MWRFGQADLVVELCVAQYCGLGGRIAMAVRDTVLDDLEALGQLPQDCVPQLLRSMREVPMQVRRRVRLLLGRDSEVTQVVDSLEEHQAAVIWGGPGEGKSSIAMEAACRLWDRSKCLGGCFAIDCLGALTSSTC